MVRELEDLYDEVLGRTPPVGLPATSPSHLGAAWPKH
jgi:hypothetical protein